MDPGTPHVAQLLRHEAAAWESLLQLQTALTAAQTPALAPHAENDASGHNSPHSRAYLSSLTHLAACGDALVAEALKLRQLRHARDTIESSMYRHVVLQHQEQFFKAGESSSRSLTTNVLQATAELRNEVARARTELTQLRSALEALDRTTLRLPTAASVVIGLRYAREAAASAAARPGVPGRRWADECEDDSGEGTGDDAAPPPLPPLQTVEEFLRRCVSHSGGTAVTDEVLLSALMQSPAPESAEQQNRFRRRKT